MKYYERYQEFLQKGIYFTQTIAYTISFLLITISIIKSAIIYIIEYINPNVDDITSFTNARLSLGESSALALSFILGVEILKLFYIKTYKQLIIVVCLVVVKLLVSYLLLKEIDDQKNNSKIYN